MDPQPAPTYMQSAKEAKGHGSALLQSTIGQHPMAAAVLLGLLIILIIVLMVKVYMLKHPSPTTPTKSSMTAGHIGSRPQPTNVSSQGSNWAQGGHFSADQSSHNLHPLGHQSPSVPYRAAPQGTYRAAPQGTFRAAPQGTYREHLAAGAPAAKAAAKPPVLAKAPAAGAKAPAAPCPPGSTTVSYQNPDGAMMVRCIAKSSIPTTVSMDCNKTPWDPLATSEAHALGMVGSLQQDGYGEALLQSAIDPDAAGGTGALSDDYLQQVMDGSS